jgi:hypothetical protein
MEYTYGNNMDGTNMGTISAPNVIDAMKKAIEIVGDRTNGRVRYYRANPLRDAAITCVSEPNCTRYELIVREIN